MTALFYAMLAFVIYTYVLYPVAIILAAKIKTRPVNTNPSTHPPYVSIILAAKNEQTRISEKITNLISQTYPADSFEIIIVSDGSNDNTNTIVNDYISMGCQPGLRLISYEHSKGKPFALNTGVNEAKGEIIVFADARQQFEHNAIEALVKNFTDPAIGGVSGELYFRKDATNHMRAQMGAYWHYEKAIRRAESAIASVVGVTGAIYAIRKELYDPIPPESLLDDVIIPMSIVLKGYRVVFESRAIAYDLVSKNSNLEWQRKVRTLAGNWQLISLMPMLYNPLINPLFIQFLSHKVCRTLVPFFLPVLLTLSMTLEGAFVTLCLATQIIGYGLAIAGFLHKPLTRYKIIGFSHFFVVMNLAALCGFWFWVTGKCGDVWRQENKGPATT